MAQLTERQAVVQHFVDKGIKFRTTIDMAVYLKSDQQQSDSQLVESKPYVDKILSAGYKSKMAQSLFEEINKGESQVDESTETE